MSQTTICRLQLLAAAFLFSTGGAAIKATTLNSWQVTAFRSGVAALAVLLLAPAARRNWNWQVPIVGLAYAATMVLFVTANKLTTSANAIFLQGAAPFYLLLLGPWLLKERIRRADILLMAVLMTGMTLFFVGEQRVFATAPDPLRGNIYAALSGVTWALIIVSLRWFEAREGEHGAGLATVVAGNAIACLFCLPMALPVADSVVTDWITVSYLGVFQIGLAYTFLTRAMKHVPAIEASLLLLAEPALNPFWSWLAHGEMPGLLAVLGGVLIMAGATGRAIQKH